MVCRHVINHVVLEGHRALSGGQDTTPCKVFLLYCVKCGKPVKVVVK